MSPMFIVIEALDGVGKTTAVHAVAARLGGVATNTPGDALRSVSDAVLDGLGENQESRCLYYAASVVARGEEARRMVDQGVPVVMDRYWLSTISYARARGVTASLGDVEAIVPPPDLTVLLVLDEAERRRRLECRGFTVADRETLDGRFREVVLATMQSQAVRRELRPGVVLDVSGLSPDEVVGAIVEVLEGVVA